MAAFVPGVPAKLATSSFLPGRSLCQANTSARTAVSQTPRMGILDGLDTSTQQPYSFSRYILGPFQGVTLSPGSSDGDREVAIRAAYRHVFGNAYIMEEERAELAVYESQFKLGAITMRDFVRAIGKSSAYKTRFFEGSSSYRFVELNFMHFLGRAPDSQAEISEHVQRYIGSGVDADIDSYIDSYEYSTVFGEDTVPFLRFRGAYTPCDSFNKQCALKGGWANSDKAMGGAALSGYNGSDGRQMSDLISSYATADATPYDVVAENTPLKSTAPNWYAVPDPALAPVPAYVSTNEVADLQKLVADLEVQYANAIERKNASSKDNLDTFRGMVKDMGPMLERGVTYSGGDPLLANPYARQMGTDEGALEAGGCKPSDYKRFLYQMEDDTVSRLEKDLEEAKGQLRVLRKALAASTPLTEKVELPGQGATTAVLAAEGGPAARPRISLSNVKKTTAADAAKAAADGKEKKGFSLPSVSMPDISMPDISLPNVSLPNPFSKKD